MTANAVNPIATARDLEAAGFERNQAEALAEAMHLDRSWAFDESHRLRHPR